MVVGVGCCGSKKLVLFLVKGIHFYISSIISTNWHFYISTFLLQFLRLGKYYTGCFSGSDVGLSYVLKLFCTRSGNNTSYLQNFCDSVKKMTKL